MGQTNLILLFFFLFFHFSSPRMTCNWNQEMFGRLKFESAKKILRVIMVTWHVKNWLFTPWRTREFSFEIQSNLSQAALHFPFNSREWPEQNFSILYLYKTIQTSGKNGKNIQYGITKWSDTKFSKLTEW